MDETEKLSTENPNLQKNDWLLSWRCLDIGKGRPPFGSEYPFSSRGNETT